MNNPIKTLINALRAGLRKQNEHVAVGSNLDNPKERIQTLIDAMHVGLHERDEHVAVILLAALSGQNIFLLGPPGTAKSLLARRLASVFGGKCFEYLMNSFSTPEEIFGPVSIAELKNDKYVRKTEGFLPTADFAFLDEIWKAGPGILNTLLTIINEKKFRNGTDIKKVPLKAVIAASNGTPSPDSGLDALYDRFVVRLYVPPVGGNHLNQMLDEEPAGSEAKCAPISVDELKEWRKRIKTVKLSPETKDIIQIIRGELRKLSSEKSEEKAYVSDRRWQQAAILLKAGAFFCGRDSTNLADTMLLRHCLWTTENNYDPIADVVKNAVVKYCSQPEKDYGRPDVCELKNNIESKLSVNCHEVEVMYVENDHRNRTSVKKKLYIPIKHRGGFTPLSVDPKTGKTQKVKNLRYVLESGSCSISVPNGDSVLSSNGYLYKSKVSVKPEPSTISLPKPPGNIKKKTIDSLKDSVRSAIACLVQEIGEVETKLSSFEQKVPTLFVPEAIPNTIIGEIKIQLSDLHSQKKEYLELLKEVKRQ